MDAPPSMTLCIERDAGSHLESCGEVSRPMHALFAVLEVGLKSAGLVALSPCHVVVGEETTGMLNGAHRELLLVEIIHLYHKTHITHQSFISLCVKYSRTL